MNACRRPSLSTQIERPHLYKTFPDSMRQKLLHHVRSRSPTTPYGVRDIAL